jgi:hypothetical protein
MTSSLLPPSSPEDLPLPHSKLSTWINQRYPQLLTQLKAQGNPQVHTINHLSSRIESSPQVVSPPERSFFEQVPLSFQIALGLLFAIVFGKLFGRFVPRNPELVVFAGVIAGGVFGYRLSQGLKEALEKEDDFLLLHFFSLLGASLGSIIGALAFPSPWHWGSLALGASAGWFYGSSLGKKGVFLLADLEKISLSQCVCMAVFAFLGALSGGASLPYRFLGGMIGLGGGAYFGVKLYENRKILGERVGLPFFKFLASSRRLSSLFPFLEFLGFLVGLFLGGFLWWHLTLFEYAWNAKFVLKLPSTLFLQGLLFSIVILSGVMGLGVGLFCKKIIRFILKYFR